VSSLGVDYEPLTSFASKIGNTTAGEIGKFILFKIFDSHGMVDWLQSRPLIDWKSDLRRNDEALRQRLPSLQRFSFDNIDMMSNWITNCKTNHPQCKVGTISWCPSRLLDVGTSHEPPYIRLIETGGVKVPLRYVALSHMWGKLVPLRALKANYTDLKSKLSWLKLSKNFREAVVVTRASGLRYLWIDSLCIIQDDPEDWRREARSMFQVYSSAEVTVVA
jgi:hypothetical protein